MVGDPYIGRRVATWPEHCTVARHSTKAATSVSRGLHAHMEGGSPDASAFMGSDPASRVMPERPSKDHFRFWKRSFKASNCLP